VAAQLVLKHRPQATLVPNYVRSVEGWLAASSRGAHTTDPPPAVLLAVDSVCAGETPPLALQGPARLD
jgi:hypothetical protein